ncbi:hypothetical protein CIB95_02520 [Lottiidibacillus patelloidae]|uniref:Uncharacterized protein n=2 Tax=Lottiidibacillus patelloidae TaxID=2670334 RepID=A0A263BYF7_9BACI|nr:hypothetical protein CIB95_02520 [Lottiidibacillus patelloidae]
MFIGSQLDGIKFGLGPETTFVYFEHYNINHYPDKLWINIETIWSIYPSITDIIHKFKHEKSQQNEIDEIAKINSLLSVRREKVTDIKLGDITPHLFITFESGKVLFVNGYHENYECWQAGDGPDFTGDDFLIVAAPQNSISTWAPESL